MLYGVVIATASIPLVLRIAYVLAQTLDTALPRFVSKVSDDALLH